ncbi:MAG: methanogen output domain 1-containing protein [Geminicoccaceae bacterium]
MNESPPPFADAPIERNRDRFLRELLRELTGILEETVGLEEAEGFISLVGGRLGQVMNDEYRAANDGALLDARQVAHALVDLKRRIEGGYSIESIDAKQIVLVNSACPFGPHVKGRRLLCMMTSNVFGRIAADNLGYARIELQKSIASGDGCCRVVIHLSEGENGREYFG